MTDPGYGTVASRAVATKARLTGTCNLSLNCGGYPALGSLAIRQLRLPQNRWMRLQASSNASVDVA